MAKKTIKKKVYQYTAIFEPDKETGGYTVTIPSLPGCISEGDTFEEALKNIKEAANLYLEVMKKKKEGIIREEKGVIIAPIEVKV
jgi:predicted RNase H-like HicB family nuclease